MNKLEQIRSSLEKNSQIKIANIRDIDRRNNPGMLLHTDLAHVVSFNVVPARNFEIDDFLAQKMQSFMQWLIPELEPDKRYDFKQEIITFREKEEEKRALLLKIGYLDFYEGLEGGLIQTVLRVDDKEHKMSRKINYVREITINPFPNKELANNYESYPFVGYIKLNLKT